LLVATQNVLAAHTAAIPISPHADIDVPSSGAVPAIDTSTSTLVRLSALSLSPRRPQTSMSTLVRCCDLAPSPRAPLARGACKSCSGSAPIASDLPHLFKCRRRDVGLASHIPSHPAVLRAAKEAATSSCGTVESRTARRKNANVWKWSVYAGGNVGTTAGHQALAELVIDCAPLARRLRHRASPSCSLAELEQPSTALRDGALKGSVRVTSARAKMRQERGLAMDRNRVLLVGGALVLVLFLAYLFDPGGILPR
jgi:hypothetical protein